MLLSSGNVQQAIGVLRRQTTPPACLMKNLPHSLLRMPCSSPAPERMSKGAVLEEKPVQNRRKRDA